MTSSAQKIKLGISSCLLGQKVRYDGGHKLDRFLAETLGAYVEWLPVCPEVESGLPAPREAMRLVREKEGHRLIAISSGKDHFHRLQQWSGRKVKALEAENLCGFVFKSGSPSSGMSGVNVYSPEGVVVGKGSGIFAQAFQGRFPLMPVEDEGRLHDPGIRESFIERIFVYKRWRELLLSEGKTLKGLVEFHTAHKLLIMAHSPRHYRELGKLVAEPKALGKDVLFDLYFQFLMQGLLLRATVRKNTNVLQHMAGHFKRHLSPDEKRELREIIFNYHRQLLPLIVPVTLIQHYVRKYDVAYLNSQIYLNPHPLELMLRNHA